MSLNHYHEIAKRSKAKGSARSILNCLAVRANENNVCWPSRDDLARESGLSTKTVSGAIKELKEIREINTKRNPRGQVFDLTPVMMLPIVTSKAESDITESNLDVTNRDSDVTNRAHRDVTNLPCDVTETVHLYKDNKENIKDINKDKERKVRPAPPDEDFGIGLKYNRGVIQQYFGPATDRIWPIAKALQQHCDIPGWGKLEGNLFELYGMDKEMPSPTDIERIATKHRKPDDDFWPYNFIKIWRRELRATKIAPPTADTKSDVEKQKAQMEINKKLFEKYAGINS